MSILWSSVFTHSRLLTMSNCFCNFFCFLAKENKVETCVVEVDVSDYENIFNVISEKLEEKEIGILGKNVLHLA